MAALPYMKMYFGDYFGDTRHLSCIQHGIYVQLIGIYFLRGGPLPDDDDYLAKSVGLSKRDWLRHRVTIAPLFRVLANEWHHKRIDAELADATSKVLKSKKAARASVERRFGACSTDGERTLNHAELELESPSSIYIEQDARAARDDLKSGRKKKKGPRLGPYQFDGEEEAMQAIRRGLEAAIGSPSYDIAFCDPERPIAFVREEGRVVARCASPLAHYMARDYAFALATVAKRHGFSDGWIREGEAVISGES